MRRTEHGAMLGCLMGAMIGDAAGATLESMRRAPTAPEVDRALKLEGGGIIQAEPGQTTAVGELTAALYWALKPHSPKDGFPADAVALAYNEWHSSGPIDSRAACSRAFLCASADAMMRRAGQHSSRSESNGALMRAAPIPVWSFREGEGVAATMARSDALLSHPSRPALDCNAVYCVAIAQLLRHPGDYVGACRAAEAYADSSCSSVVRSWMEQDATSCMLDAGHARHALVLAMSCLRRNLSFRDAVRIALQQGGDTNANASIVGGVMGALHGLRGLPDEMLDKVLACDSDRPSQYSAKALYFDMQLEYIHSH